MMTLPQVSAWSGKYNFYKNLRGGMRGATGRNLKEKTHKKLNISLPKELHAWVLKRQAEENKKSRLSKTAISTIIAYAVEQAKIRDDNDKLLMEEHLSSKEEIAPTTRHSSPTIHAKKTRGK
jgi:hypothetical protein